MKKISFLILTLLFQMGYSQQNNFSAKLFVSNAESSINEQGCLSAPLGQYPDFTYEPMCQGIDETFTAAGSHGEYSLIHVNEGTEYIFSTDAEAVYITISDGEGTTVYAAGYTSVTWTSTVTGEIRYYLHKDANCTIDSNEYLRKSVRCGQLPDEPEYNCNQNYVGPYYAASSASGDGNFMVADDFFVPADSQIFNMETLTYLLLPLEGTDADFKNFDIHFLSDNAGAPGEIIASYTGLTATSIVENDEDFMGFKTFHVTLTLPEDGQEFPVNAESPTRFWVALQAWSNTEQNIFTAGFHRVEGWQSAPNHQSADNGETWNTTIYEEDPGLENIWSFEAVCDQLFTTDHANEKITFYPNPVTDVLNISTKTEILELAVYTLSGQKLNSIKQISNNQLDTSSWIAGTYFVHVKLINGQNKVINVIKK